MSLSCNKGCKYLGLARNEPPCRTCEVIWNGKWTNYEPIEESITEPTITKFSFIKGIAEKGETL